MTVERLYDGDLLAIGGWTHEHWRPPIAVTPTGWEWGSSKIIKLGRGRGQVVSVLAFYSDDPSSNPTEAYSFSVKFVFEKNKNKQKEAGVGPLNFLKFSF